jgi:hypothetical protein
VIKVVRSVVWFFECLIARYSRYSPYPYAGSEGGNETWWETAWRLELEIQRRGLRVDIPGKDSMSLRSYALALQKILDHAPTSSEVKPTEGST